MSEAPVDRLWWLADYARAALGDDGLAALLGQPAADAVVRDAHENNYLSRPVLTALEVLRRVFDTLVAAGQRPELIAAVVSRGGRPDLAADALADVMAPTLLIVGELDTVVIELNRRAMAQLTCPVRLEIVPGATHLFEEPGTLDEVTSLATSWFVQYLQKSTTP